MKRGVAFAICFAMMGLLHSGSSQARRFEFKLNDLPAERLPGRHFYPHHLSRQGVTGRVSVAYSIDGRGVPKNIAVLGFDDHRLQDAATNVIKDLRFKVPADWEATGRNWHRYRIQISFLIKGMAVPPTWEEGSDNIIITNSGESLR